MFSILEVGTPSLKMEKRLVTAVLISIVFIAILQWAAPRLFPGLAQPEKPAVTSTRSPASPKPAATTTSTTAGAGGTSTVAPAPVAAASTAPATIAAHPVTPIAAETQQISV